MFLRHHQRLVQLIHNPIENCIRIRHARKRKDPQLVRAQRMRRIGRVLQFVHLAREFAFRWVQFVRAFMQRLAAGQRDFIERRIENREFYVGIIQAAFEYP